MNFIKFIKIFFGIKIVLTILILLPLLVYSRNILSYIKKYINKMTLIKLLGKKTNNKLSSKRSSSSLSKRSSSSLSKRSSSSLSKRSWLGSQSSIKNKPDKMVVFDLDETLGCFTELSIFWDALESYYGHNLFNDKFFEVMDTFPEFCRPNILPILDYINNQRKNKLCKKIMIYTNNQGYRSWVKMISDYFNKKLGYTVFDQLICAYKVQGKIVEPNRTSHEKSVKDLISCTKIAENTEICFVDDLYHPLMDKDNVMYIHIKPYHFMMSYNLMAERYYNTILNRNNTSTIDKNEFIDYIVKFMQRYQFTILNKSDAEKTTDKLVSKQLLSYLEVFFKKGNKKHTRKQGIMRNSKTKHNFFN